ncbi:MAG: Do family serine endopeptidase [Hyphomicrobiaceae bacterium]
MSKTTTTKHKTGRRVMAALVAGAVAAGPVVGSFPAVAAPNNQVAGQAVQGFADIIAEARPAVVSVLAQKSMTGKAEGVEFNFENLPDQFREFFKRFGDRDGSRFNFKMPEGKRPFARKSEAQGAGFFVSEDGYIVTNNHVVADAKKIVVATRDGKKLDARLVGADPKTDLAVLKVDGSDFPHVAFGESADVRVGDWVIAVGNPFGLSGTTTVGIVSARGRDIGNGALNDFIQIDAPINRGNSGGPAFNSKGEVIGVNTAIFSPTGGNVGIGFAVPSDTAKSIVESLISDGHISRGWLGVTVQPVTKDIADSLGLDKAEGALVAAISENTPAERAAMKAGDLVTMVDDKKIESPRDLARVIAAKESGSNVEIRLLRGGEDLTLSVKLANLPGQKRMAANEKSEKSEKQDRAKLGLMLRETGDGVEIAKVIPDTPAADKGLKSGEVIRQINGKSVKSVEDVRKQVASAAKEGKKHVLMLLKGKQGNRFVALALKQA